MHTTLCGHAGRRWPWTTLLTLLLLGCAGDPTESRRPPQLVILFATCSVNKSFLSPYNASVSYTPHLERFSREGYVFNKHRTEAGLSGIAFASILSGSQAFDHNVFRHPSELPGFADVISESFTDAGYESFVWNSHSMASPELNYTQGVPPGNVSRKRLSGTDPRFLEILETLRLDPESKAFVVTTFTATHAPYKDLRSQLCSEFPAECPIEDLSDAWIERHLELYYRHFRGLQYALPQTAEALGLTERDVASLARLLDVLYRSNVQRLDQMFGGVVESVREAGLLDRAVIAFTADHGEKTYTPGDEAQWSHGGTLQSEVLDVPLILRAPGQSKRSQRADFVTRSIDVFPTLAGLAGVPLPDNTTVTGFDLSSYIRGHAAPPQLEAFSHTGVFRADALERFGSDLGYRTEFFTGDKAEETWVALRQDDLVFKHRNVGGGEWRFQAFDLFEDPTESHDLFDPDDPVHRKAAARLRRYKSEFVRAHAVWKNGSGGSDEGLNEEDVQRLRSMGYIQ